MFFRRSSSPAAASSAATATAEAPRDGASPAAEADVSPMLDAFGQLMAAFAHGVFDMPEHPVVDVRARLDAWRRHATIGSAAPIDLEQIDSLDAEPDQLKSGLPLNRRQWGRTTSAFSEHRRIEKLFVETALADLREALWLCVERTHQVLEHDDVASVESAEHMGKLRGALDRLETGVIKTEITAALRSLDQVTEKRLSAQQAVYGKMAEQIEALGSQLDEARKASETDALTGLGNRLCFDRAAARQLHLHALSGSPLALILLDLDRLKAINDTLGHQAGDEALSALAKCLHRVFLRESDILCRIGGDEFAVVLPGTSEVLAAKLVERLRTTIAAEAWPYTEQGLPLSASIGLAAWQRGEDLAAWAARADAGVYQNKKAAS